MPVGAVAGPARIMDYLAPLGPVYQAGTLSGNPIAMTSGLATLEIISEPGFHELLERQTKRLCEGIRDAAKRVDVALTTNHVCGMFGLFFTDVDKVTEFTQVMACDANRFKRFFKLMLDRGINLAPSPFEVGFVSSAHGDAEIDATIDAAAESFERIAAGE